MATPEQPLVTQADLDAYIASYQKAQADQAAALAAAQATGMSDQYTQLYGGADIIPGMTQGILSNLGIENPYLPVYTLRGSANKGDDSANERMSFAPLPGMEYRLVDKNTGQVITASTPEEIKALAEAANALGKSGGAMANYAIESGQGGKYSTMYEDTPDVSKFDRLAGMALPIAVSLIPGLQGVGAVLANTAAGAAGSAIAGGDPLKGAIMGGLTSAGTQFLGPVVQSTQNALGQTVATNLGRAVGAGAGATAGGLATGKSLENSLLGGAIAGGSTYLGGELFGPKDLASDDLVTQNINRALANLENGLIDAGAFGPDFLDAVYKSEGLLPKTSTVSSGDTVVTATTPRVTTTGAATPGLIPNIDVTALRDMATKEGDTSYTMPGTTTLPSDYVVTGEKLKTDTKADTKNDGPPIVVTGTGAQATDTKADTTKNNDGTIVVTGTQNTPKFDSDGTYKGDLTYIPSLVDDIVQQEQSGDTKDKKDSDLKKVLEYLSLASLGADLLGSVVGGGGKGGGTGTPYVSPFGPGVGGGFGAGLASRTQINPNIIDYERYGFGPEALFFSGGQANPAPTTAPSQVYTPLIGGNTGGMLGAIMNPVSGSGPVNMTEEQRNRFMRTMAPSYDPNRPMISNGPYMASPHNNPVSYTPNAPGSNPDAMNLMNINLLDALTGTGLMGRLQQDFNRANAMNVMKTDGTVPTQLTQEELWGIMS